MFMFMLTPFFFFAPIYLWNPVSGLITLTQLRDIYIYIYDYNKVEVLDNYSGVKINL